MRRLALAATVLVTGCGGGDPGPTSSESFDSPTELAVAFLEERETQARTTTVVSERMGEAGPRATIDVTLEGLLDDSVGAVRYLLAAEERDGAWRLVSSRREQRCLPGRGHEEFSTEPCL